MMLESACLPVPSEIVMPFSGYLASTGRFDLLLAVTVGAIGCNIGSTFVYTLGATGGRQAAKKWGHYIFLTDEKLNRVDRYFQRYGAPTIFFARLLPMIPVVVSFPAGIARMPMWKFQIYTFAGCWLWCGVLALSGYEFGTTWQSNPWVRSATHWFNIAVVVFVALGLAWLMLRKWRNRAAG